MIQMGIVKALASKCAQGEKTSTIRPKTPRWNKLVVGDHVRLVCGARMGPKAEIMVVRIVAKRAVLIGFEGFDTYLAIDNEPLDDRARGELAVREGFSCFSDLLEFIERTYWVTFKGWLFEWEPVGEVELPLLRASRRERVDGAPATAASEEVTP